jgi:hypothetical protein
MCVKCAYALEGTPNECLECDICSRNPTNVSKKFKKMEYKDTLIEKPIDMYISEEHLKIILEEVRKMYQWGARTAKRVPPNNPDEWNLLRRRLIRDFTNRGKV